MPLTVRRCMTALTVLPMLALCLVGLFGFVALAVDLGMLAVSRTECQNAADIGALIGCRTLNNKPESLNSNLDNAVATARLSESRWPAIGILTSSVQVLAMSSDKPGPSLPMTNSAGAL